MSSAQPQIEVIAQGTGFQVFSERSAAQMMKMEDPPLMLSNIAIARNREQRHILAIGTPGAGKTMAIRQIACVVRRRNQPAVFGDHGGEAIQYFYRDGIDVILNPMDERSVGWSLFNEYKKIGDFKRYAKMVVHDTDNNQDFTEGAQQIFADVTRALWNLGKDCRTNEALLYYLMKAPKRGPQASLSLQWLLRNQPSARLFEEGNDDKGLGIMLGIISRCIEPFTYLKDGDFSITDYVKSFEHVGVTRKWLFLSYTDENYESISPLMAIWMECAVQAGLSLSESSERRFWFFLDELASLKKMNALYDALTKLRKYGGAVVAGIQSTAQLQARYGDKGAQTLFSCFGTLLMLRVSDDETAEKLSRIMGDTREQVASTSSTTSLNGNSNTTSESEQQRRRVMPVDFTTYDDLTGWLRVAGSKSAIRIGGNKVPPLPITILDKIAEKEISRQDTSLAWLDEQLEAA